jgi:hypothetical protein
MDKKFWISGIAILILSMAIGFLVHGFLLAPDYTALIGKTMRSPEEANSLFHFMIIAHIFMAFGATWIYRQGVTEAAWLTQGVRFGIAMACVVAVPMFLIYYVVQPTPGMLTVKQIVFDSISWIVVGIVLAFINKK